MSTFLLASTTEESKNIGSELFNQFLEFKRATDPDVVTSEGTVMYRSPFTGEIEPDAPHSREWGAAQPAIQGLVLPLPEHEAYSTPSGAAVVANFNAWPSFIQTEKENILPEWVQPTGGHDAYPLNMWVTHQGYDYCSLMNANVWEPSPQSTLWRISPDPGPLPWVRPTGATDAYSIGDLVTHTVAGRDITLWRSNIVSNTTEPGNDGTFDRWWEPLSDNVVEALDWVQPMPGTTNTPYELGNEVLHNTKRWRSTTQLNVWEPSIFGWEEVV